jgi:hypothetical protein
MMTGNSKICAGLVLTILILGGGVTAAQAETASATARATVYRPTTLASLLDLNFGTIISDGVGGQVELDAPGNNRNCGAGFICSGGYTFATLLLTGSNAVVQITYAPIVQLTGPGDPMDLAIQFPGGSGAMVPIVANSATIQFGALLTVNPDQTGGDYSGNFSVDVNYP